MLLFLDFHNVTEKFEGMKLYKTKEIKKKKKKKYSILLKFQFLFEIQSVNINNFHQAEVLNEF